MGMIDRLKRRRDRLQGQLDQWIAREFRGGRFADHHTPEHAEKETARKISDVADLNRIIAEQEAKDRNS